MGASTLQPLYMLAYALLRTDHSRSGLGIAFVSAVHAKVPVLLHDRSATQVKSGLSLMDKLLAKDVAKGKMTQEAAKEARDRVSVVDSLSNFRDTDMVVEVSKLSSLHDLGLQCPAFALWAARAVRWELLHASPLLLSGWWGVRVLGNRSVWF